MILGIAFFSYVMGNFNDMAVSDLNELSNRHKGSDLQKWIVSLSKWTDDKPLPTALVDEITEHF